MARKFYQIILNGKDIPGLRWATIDAARFALKIEAENMLWVMQKKYPNENYRIESDPDWDWADLIHTERTGYQEPLVETKAKIFGIRVGTVGEEKNQPLRTGTRLR